MPEVHTRRCPLVDEDVGAVFPSGGQTQRLMDWHQAAACGLKAHERSELMTSSRWLRHVTRVGLMAAASLSLAVGTASADANAVLAPLVNTSCSYAQITTALNAEAPDLASLLNGRPQAQSRLQQFLALPPSQRQQRLDQQLAANPQAQAMIDAQLGSAEAEEVTQVVNTCNKY